MPSNYQTLLSRLRDEGHQRLEFYRVRYSSGPPATALRLAQQWYAALASEPLDWRLLSAIRDEARENRMNADIAFFGFINELDRDYPLLRQAEMESDETRIA
jgi:hypothetical protein